MGTIVVGVDGSETAWAACQEASRLAGALGSRLHLVTAIEPSSTVVVGVGSDEVAVDSGSDAELMLKRLKTDLPDSLDVTGSVVTGKPAKALVTEAERVEADLIVVGSRHMQGVKRVLGSVANDVSHHAPCSVYIAKTT